MNIYSIPEQDKPLFESLRLFQFDESKFGPWESSYCKHHHPMYGISRPDVSLRNKQNSGENHPSKRPNYTHPLKDKHHSEETKQKMSGPRECMSGINHPNFNKPMSDKVRKSLLEANLGRKPHNYNKPHLEKTKQLMKLKRSGKVWWNNGTKTTMSVSCPGEGWSRGRLSS